MKKRTCCVHFPICTYCTARFSARRSDTIYCSEPCKRRAANAIKVREGRQRVTPTNWCACGKPIRVTAQSCNQCCAEKKAAKRRKEARRRRVLRKLSAAAAGKPANDRWPLVQGVCRGCGEWFTRRGSYRGSSPYCSRECRPEDAVGWKWISAKRRASLYERDGWICQLCMGPVDSSLPPQDDWAASLDHIKCRSWGSVDHSSGNLRLAHRWCNSVRGNKKHYAPSDLLPAA